METIGFRIKEARKKKGMTLEQISAKAECASSYMSQLENGIRKNPSAEKLFDIARTLDVTIEYLLGLENMDKAEDRAFLRAYSELDSTTRWQLREIAKILGKKT